MIQTLPPLHIDDSLLSTTPCLLAVKLQVKVSLGNVEGKLEHVGERLKWTLGPAKVRTNIGADTEASGEEAAAHGEGGLSASPTKIRV